MSGRKPGQHANLWLVFGSIGDCQMRYHLSPRSNTDMLYRKLASKLPASTRQGGLSHRYQKRQAWKERTFVLSQEFKAVLNRILLMGQLFPRLFQQRCTSFVSIREPLPLLSANRNSWLSINTVSSTMAETLRVEPLHVAFQSIVQFSHWHYQSTRSLIR